MKPENMKPDLLLFNGLFGLVLPVLCFLMFWWGSLLFTNEERTIGIIAVTGLGIGTIISIIIRLIRKFDIYRLSVPILVMVYLFYNIGMFGFFMGVPVFHLVLGPIAGFYWAKRLVNQNRPVNYPEEIRRILRFTSLVISGICLLSAAIALSSKSTPDDIRHMLRLSFDISIPVLIVFIIAGGAFLITIQYWLTKFIMLKVLKINKSVLN
jgi:hypothetical protein